MSEAEAEAGAAAEGLELLRSERNSTGYQFVFNSSKPGKPFQAKLNDSTGQEHLGYFGSAHEARARRRAPPPRGSSARAMPSPLPKPAPKRKARAAAKPAAKPAAKRKAPAGAADDDGDDDELSERQFERRRGGASTSAAAARPKRSAAAAKRSNDPMPSYKEASGSDDDDDDDDDDEALQMALGQSRRDALSGTEPTAARAEEEGARGGEARGEACGEGRRPRRPAADSSDDDELSQSRRSADAAPAPAPAAAAEPSAATASPPAALPPGWSREDRVAQPSGKKYSVFHGPAGERFNSAARRGAGTARPPRRGSLAPTLRTTSRTSPLRRARNNYVVYVCVSDG